VPERKGQFSAEALGRRAGSWTLQALNGSVPEL